MTGVVHLEELPLLLRPIGERLTGLGYEITYAYLRPVVKPGRPPISGKARLVAVKNGVRLRVVLFRPKLRIPEDIHFYRWVKHSRKAGELVEFETEGSFWAFAEGGCDVEQGNQADERK